MLGSRGDHQAAAAAAPITAARVQFVVEQPPFGQLVAGRCWWCGEQLVDKQATARQGRLYCRLEREGRDCLTARRQSVASSPREALMKAARPAGHPLRCCDCDLVVAELDTQGNWARPAGGLGWRATYETALEHGGAIALDNLRVRCLEHATHFHAGDAGPSA